MQKENDLSGKVAIITGANQGLGFAIAKRYVSAGANVMLCARNEELLQIAQTELMRLATKQQVIRIKPADVSIESEVNAIVHETLHAFGGCHILVNNAGIHGPKGPIESVDWSLWMKALEINLLGSILMCRAILPHFKAQASGKIIQLSGGGATKPMPRLSAYATSKAAIVRFTETLAEEVREYGIDVNALAPGALNTRLLDDILATGPEAVGTDYYNRSLKQKINGGDSIESAADLALFLASSASKGITGKLISAQWDNWSEWPKHLDVLTKSDAYTLRRITGKDRGLTWGDR